MATDQEVASDTAVAGAPGAAGTAPGRPKASAQQPLSRTAIVVSSTIGVLLVAWFFVAWLALDYGLVDSAGMSVGSAFALLLVVSVVGALRRNRKSR